MRTLAFEKVRGHMIVPLDGRNALLDTGSPISMAPLPFEFLGTRHHPVSNLMGTTVESMTELSGVQIDILIGCDVLRTSDMRIRWGDAEIDFGDELPIEGVVQPMETTWGPSFALAIEHVETRAILDTGAHLSYIDPALVANLTACGEVEDFHPLVGRFTAQTYAVPTTIAGHEFRMTYGVLPPILQQMMSAVFDATGVKAVIGTLVFEEYNCLLAWQRRQIAWWGRA